MAEPSPVPSVSTFVVHFWREWSDAGTHWRGRIEHVQSGQKSATFRDLGEMLDFIHQFNIMGDDESRPAKRST